MDLGFHRETLWRHRQPAPLDHARLVAALGLAQTASRTAVVQAQLGAGPPPGTDPVDALVLLFGAGQGGTAATTLLAGSFAPHVATALKEARREPR